MFGEEVAKLAKRWTEEERNMLTKIHMLYTNKELAEIFGVSEGSISGAKAKLGLSSSRTSIVKEGHKKCCMCKEILPLENFNKNKSKSDGYETMCLVCRKLYRAQRIIKINNLEKTNAVDEYIKKKKNVSLFCAKCNESKTIDDYYIELKKDNSVTRRCKKCVEIKNKERLLKNLKTRGY